MSDGPNRPVRLQVSVSICATATTYKGTTSEFVEHFNATLPMLFDVQSDDILPGHLAPGLILNRDGERELAGALCEKIRRPHANKVMWVEHVSYNKERWLDPSSTDSVDDTEDENDAAEDRRIASMVEHVSKIAKFQHP